MLKKKLWIVALIAALAMVFASCGGGGGPGEEPEANFELVLGDNFQWGHGYQTSAGTGDPHISVKDYTTGTVNPGDEFTIKFKVKTSRDLEDALDFGLVDTAAAVDYWKKLTPVYAVGPKTTANAGEGDTKGPPWIKAGDEYVIDLVMVVTDAPSGQADANLKFYFQTSGKCDNDGCGTEGGCDWTKPQGTPNSGVEGPVTLTFTDFVFERKGEPVAPCCTDCADGCADCIQGQCLGNSKCGTECCVVEKYEGTKLVVKVGAGTSETTATGEGTTDKVADVKYLDNNSGYRVIHKGEYGSSYATFKVDFGTGKSLADYEKIKFTFQGIEGDIGYKTLYLLAKGTAITGSMNTTGTPAAGGYLELKIGEKAYSNSGITATGYEFDLTGVSIAGKDVWFSVYLHAGANGNAPDAPQYPGDGKPTTFVVSGIEFVEKGAGTAVTMTATDNGSATATTTSISLNFAAPGIIGLTAADITIDDTADSTGATKGTLTTTGAPHAYALAITGVTKAGNISVAVAKDGYVISGSPATIAVDFVAALPTPTVADFTITIPTAAVFTGSAIPVTVVAKDSKDAGAISIKYNDVATVPVNAGTYVVTFDVAGGTDFAAATGLAGGDLAIAKAAAYDGTATLTEDDHVLSIEYTAGTNFKVADLVGLTYAWTKDDSPITDATSATLTTTGAGVYKAEITSSNFTAPIETAGFTLLSDLPGILVLKAPAAGNVYVGTELTATYTPSAASEAPTLKWYKDDVAVSPEETDTTYTPTEAGTYTVIASLAGYHSIESNPIIVLAKCPICDKGPCECIPADKIGGTSDNFTWNNNGNANQAGWQFGGDGSAAAFVASGKFNLLIQNAVVGDLKIMLQVEDVTFDAQYGQFNIFTAGNAVSGVTGTNGEYEVDLETVLGTTDWSNFENADNPGYANLIFVYYGAGTDPVSALGKIVVYFDED